MSEASAESLAQRALNLGLVNERQLQLVWGSLASQNVTGAQMLQMLVRQGVLTNFQVERLLNGERSGFFYGDYKVLYVVGAGTFARVFRATHKTTDRVAAVKVLRSRFSDNPATSAQFIQEGEVGVTLRHPNIVPIYEVISEGRQHCIVMEFVEGQNLREFIKIRRRFEPLEASRIIQDACAGLVYAAERGIYHRDLKLSNVLVSSQGKAKLVDFGMAGMSERLMDQQQGDVDAHTARTVDYAALERITKVQKHDSRSDIYFMGAMLYHLLTGEAPLLETRDRAKRMSRQRFTDVRPILEVVPDLPMSVAMIVNKAMSLEVERRYQTIADMHADLAQVVARLESGDTATHADAPLGATAAAVAEPAAPREAQTVLVVESNAQMQDILRDGFKKAGYRVLVTADPKRAVQRMLDDATAADCVVFNAQLLGNKAVKGFNALVDDLRTKDVPALLLLDDNQKRWARECTVAPHRLIIGMPVTMKQLRMLVQTVVDVRRRTQPGG